MPITGRIRARLTASSRFERLHDLNQIYRAKFGFPFIIAVRNHTKTSILEAFVQRIANSPDAEMAQALAEIAQIAGFRLQEQVVDSG